MKSRGRSSTRAAGVVVGFGAAGDACVELDGGTRVFVSGGLPGDRVEVERDGARARLVRVVEPSADREPMACSVAERCGGCPTMGLPAALDAEHKTSRVIRALGGDVPVEFVHAPARLGYRRRARLAFVGGRFLGFLSRRSATVVDVATCAVLVPALDAALANVRAKLLPLLHGRGELALALGASGRPVAHLRCELAQPEGVYRALDDCVGRGEFAGASLEADGAVARFADPREHTVALDGTPLVGTVFGFSQVHDAIADALAARVLAWAAPSGRDVLELYAGHGHLTLGLAASARTLVAVELAPAACEALRENLRVRGLPGEVVVGRAEDFPRRRYGVVVADPPREGLAAAAQAIVESGASDVVLVSCDVRALARDVHALRAGGYEPVHAAAFDMFPQTAHVESLVHLTRSRAPTLAATMPRR